MKVDKVKLKNSSVKGKLPQSDDLDFGEVAINYAKGSETFSIKNSEGEIKTLGNQVSIGTEMPTDEFTPMVELFIDESVDPASVEVYTQAEIDQQFAAMQNTFDQRVNGMVVVNNNATEAPSSIMVEEGTTQDVEVYTKAQVDAIVEQVKGEIPTLEVVLDSAEYNNIILGDTNGPVKPLSDYEVGINMSKTEMKKKINDIKFVRINDSSNSHSTVFNIVYTMPQYPLFCCYCFNKLDNNYMGIGYLTIQYKTENTVKISSVRSTMAITK